MVNLQAISPIDGRYNKNTEELSEYFSEYALIKYRIIIEINWLIKLLNETKNHLTEIEISKLNDIIFSFSVEEAQKVKDIEATTKHDVKAIEYYLRDKFKENNLEKYSNFIHFGCTSEDINNLSYGLMIKDGLEKVLIPNMEKLVNSVKENALQLCEIPMLSHTHGQPATPTTVGKELAVFVYRWNRVLNLVKSIQLCGKFSGAVGNFNAHIVAYPNLNWINISKSFIESLGLEYNPLTTQIESHDMFCILFNYLKAFNAITMDFNSDMWLYISMGYFKQKVIKGEVGSSVMPHKVNPINHENSMANIRIANSIFETLSENLPVSRMQRDLSDSSSERNIGVGFAHTLISIKQSVIGFEKMLINEQALLSDLNENCEVLAEPIQTVLRKNGVTNAYELLKELTRGKDITITDIRNFISSLEIPKNDKNKLLSLTPANYIGLANKLVDFIN